MAQRIHPGEARRLHRAHALEKLSFARTYGHGGAYWRVEQWQGNAQDDGREKVVFGTVLGYIVDTQIGLIDKDASTGYDLPQSYAFYTTWDIEMMYHIQGSRALPAGAPALWIPSYKTLVKGLHLISLTEPIWHYTVIDKVPRRGYLDNRVEPA